MAVKVVWCQVVCVPAQDPNQERKVCAPFYDAVALLTPALQGNLYTSVAYISDE